MSNLSSFVSQFSLIRLPDFVTRDDFEWAVKEAEKKKKEDFSARLLKKLE